VKPDYKQTFYLCYTSILLIGVSAGGQSLVSLPRRQRRRQRFAPPTRDDETMMTAQEPLTTALATIPAVLEEIRQVYRQHAFPWVIGYSGGKDSTTALQLVWLALAGLPPEERTRPVHVISSDTLVETPMIVDYINDALDRINRVAATQNMPNYVCNRARGYFRKLVSS